MEMTSLILVLAVIFGFYMTWNIGANDVANAMGTSVGSKALTLRKAVFIAAILEFSGAFFVGSNVSETIQKGIIDPNIFNHEPMVLVYGMLSALLATSLWLQLASYYGWPVSTTHSIIGSLLGFGLIYGGMHAVHWDELLSIIISWVLSPLLGAALAFLVFSLIQRKILYSPLPIKAAKRIAPWFFFVLFAILTLSLVYDGLKNLHLNLSLFHAIGISIIVGLIAFFISSFALKKISSVYHSEEEEEVTQISNFMIMHSLNKSLKNLRRTKSYAQGDLEGNITGILDQLEQVSHNMHKDIQRHRQTIDYSAVERIFVPLQIASASFIAFAHGANDVANAIGPLAAIFTVVKTKSVHMQAVIPAWMLALGGLGIVIGLATWGWRVIETIGKKITDLTPTRGFSAEIASATTILLASKMGLPISTTHTLVGSVLGVGFARGISALNLSIIRNIAGAWIITIPAGAILTILIFSVYKAIAMF